MNRTLRAALAGVGRPTLIVLDEARGLLSVALQTFAALARGEVDWRQVVLQCYLIGNRSLLFVTVTLGFLGLITVYQVALQVQQILPDYTMLGPAFLQMMIREFAPTITGLMIATRVGSGIAAEIGSMTVTEQVDALRMCNADPVTYLVVPRTVACTLMLLMLTIYAVLVATLSGMLIANTGFGVNFRTFLNLQLVTWDDLTIGAAKALTYGFAIPIIAGHAGLTATGGSAGVGWATTRSVVNTSFAVVVLDFVLSGAGYVLLGD